jgi:excisionase family DNA binding protein
LGRIASGFARDLAPPVGEASWTALDPFDGDELKPRSGAQDRSAERLRLRLPRPARGWWRSSMTGWSLRSRVGTGCPCLVIQGQPLLVGEGELMWPGGHDSPLPRFLVSGLAVGGPSRVAVRPSRRDAKRPLTGWCRPAPSVRPEQGIQTEVNRFPEEAKGGDATSVIEMKPELLRVEEVAWVLQIGRTKVYELIGAGELPVVRIGRSVRIPRHWLERWIAERTVAA